MANDFSNISPFDWRRELPPLSGRQVLLREPLPQDLRPLLDIVSSADACRFGMDDDPITDVSVTRLIDTVRRERAAGLAFTYVVTIAATRAVAGLIRVRQQDPGWEGAEWECTLSPSSRGTGIFIDAVRLVGSFTFGTLGAHRLEARVLLQNGRGNGALHKVGAVQEGVLRRSLRRGGAYHDEVLWSVLKDDWGKHWVAAGPRVH